MGLLWNNGYEVQILQSSINFIHTGIKEKKSGNLFQITFVYGNPLFRLRRQLWPKLELLQPLRSGPWCLMGDFNEMLSISDKEGLDPVAPIRLQLFREFLDNANLMDLQLKGSKFTWISNPRD